MANSHGDDILIPEEEIRQVGDRWLFLKVIGGVVIGLVVLVFVLSPQIYFPAMRDTPEVHRDRARGLADEKKFDEAIEAYEKVLSFQQPPKKIFVEAKVAIKNIRELKRLRQGTGTEGTLEGDGGGAEGGEGAAGKKPKQEKPGEGAGPEKAPVIDDDAM